MVSDNVKIRRLSFYDLMYLLDGLTLEFNEDYDLRSVTVHCNKVNGVEVLFFKYNEKVLKTIAVNKFKEVLE